MSFKIIPGLLLAAYVLAQGLWILAVSPDPPAGARAATRKSRQMVAIGAVVLGVFLIALFVSEI